MSARPAIFVAEDEGMIAMMIEEYLDILGYDLFGVAFSLAEGIAMADGGARPAAALLDCRLGEERSWPIARALAARGVPVIFMTGAPDDVFPGDLAGTVTLSKPFTLAILGEALDQALENSRTA